MLKHKRKQLISHAEQALGKELTALQAALERSSASVMQTTEAIASSLRVIDEVVPEIAWEFAHPALFQVGEGFMD